MNNNLPPKRPSQADVARVAGVSAMTVSLCLRGHGSIPDTTRKRIKKIADELGYRPDPMVSKLMRHLRMGEMRRASFSVCILQQRSPYTSTAYQDYIVAGAKETAEGLGYFFEAINIDAFHGREAAFRRMLRARNVEGVILAPLWTPTDLSELLDWSQYAVVSTSNSVLGPRVHRVLPNQFANTLLLTEEIRRRGYQRIGLIIEKEYDVRTRHRTSAAVLWANSQVNARGIDALEWEGTFPSQAKLQKWFRRIKPDAVICSNTFHLDLLVRVYPEAKQLFLCTATVTDPWSPYAGMVEDPTDVGHAAVELLSVLMQKGERGIPAKPRVTMLTGTFRPAHDETQTRPPRLAQQKVPAKSERPRARGKSSASSRAKA